MDREARIVRACLVNVAGNVMLALMKGVAGVLAGSIAIICDAVGSLADALSSIIAIIGTKIAARPASPEHPFGYGRSEYIASIVIAALILATGLSSLKESVASILNPSTPNYTTVALVIVAIAAAAKFGLSFFLMSQGKQLGSATLTASGQNALMDAFVSVSTLVAAFVFIWFGVLVEAWLAAIISFLIIKNGFDLLAETTSKLLGERADPELIAKVEREIRSLDGVKLASGVTLHDFGPNRVLGSAFVTVDGQMTVAEYDAVAREVQRHVFKSCNVVLGGLTPYAATSDESARDVRATVGRIVWAQDHVVELRGLYVDTEAKSLRFDATVELGYRDFQGTRAIIESKCQEALPDWTINVRVIPDVSD